MEEEDNENERIDEDRCGLKFEGNNKEEKINKEKSRRVDAIASKNNEIDNNYNWENGDILFFERKEENNNRKKGDDLGGVERERTNGKKIGKNRNQ